VTLEASFMKEPEKQLKESLNLSDHEAKLYMAGLQFDQATLSDIARVARISRTAAYPPLKSLTNKGLISSITIGKRTHYRSINPKYLRPILDERLAKLDNFIEESIQRISVTESKFSTQYFAGVRGIEIASDIFLNESKTKLWRTFEQPQYPLEKSGEKRFDEYILQRVQKCIHARGIMTGNVLQTPWIKNHIQNAGKILAEVILVSPHDYPFEASIATDGEQVLQFSAKRIPFAILTKNPEIAKTIESIHALIWDRYKK
jgi:sugar-specific transcriptional regulator TrmB